MLFFGKVKRLASEEVTLQLAKSKCIPVLIYGRELLLLLLLFKLM